MTFHLSVPLLTHRAPLETRRSRRLRPSAASLPAALLPLSSQNSSGWNLLPPRQGPTLSRAKGAGLTSRDLFSQLVPPALLPPPAQHTSRRRPRRRRQRRLLRSPFPRDLPRLPGLGL